MMEFRVINKNVEANKTSDGVLHIRGIANTGLEDLAGDTFSTEALQHIVEQATTHNLHMDHDTTINGVLGPITTAELTSDGVVIEADIVNSEYQQKILELLDGGANFGLSVSGVSLLDKNKPNDINNIALTEISLTPIPCDQNTMGSVTVAKSFAEVFKSIRDDNDVMEVEKMAEETITKAEVIDLINEAFNERREEYLEEIRGELKNEYEVRINELEARIESLESEDKNDEEEGEETVEEVVATEETSTETKAGGVPKYSEEEILATEEEEEEEKEEEKEEEEEEDVKKNIETILEETINKKLEQIFKNKNASELSFKYKGETESDAEQEEVSVQKNVFTIREAAEQLARK